MLNDNVGVVCLRRGCGGKGETAGEVGLNSCEGWRVRLGASLTRFLTWLFSVVLVLQWSPTAHGDDLPTVEDLLTDGGGRQRPVPMSPDEIVGPQVERLQLRLTWSQRQTASDQKEKDEHLKKFMTLVESFGDPNRPIESMVLLKEAAEAFDVHQADLARLRIEQARKLSPDFPHSYFAEGRLLESYRPMSLFERWQAVKLGYQKSWGVISSRVVVEFRILVAVTISMLLGFLLMTVLALFRYFPLLANDLRRVLPRGVTQSQMIMLLLMSLVIVHLMWGSLLGLLCVVLLLGAAYMSWTERLVAGLLFGVLLLAPNGLSISQQVLTWSGSESEKLSTISLGVCEASCQEMLEARATEDALSRLVLSTVLLRVAPKESAKEAAALFKKQSEEKSSISSLRAVALNNLGVAKAVLGKRSDAASSFEAALRLSPRDYTPLLNLAQLKRLQRDPEGMKEAIERVIDMGGGEDALKVVRVKSQELNRLFKVQSIPGEVFYGDHAAKSQRRDSTGSRALAKFGGRLRGEELRQMGGVGLLVLLFWSVSGWWIRPSTHCARCFKGTPRGGHMPSNKLSRGECEDCHKAFFENKMAYKERLLHERRIQRVETQRKWTLRLGNIIFPGLGSSLTHHPVGVLLGLMASLGLGLLLTGLMMLPDPWRLSGWMWDDGSKVVLGLLLGLSVVASLGLTMLGLPVRPSKRSMGGNKGERRS